MVFRKLITDKHAHYLLLSHLDYFFQRCYLPDGIESQIERLSYCTSLINNMKQICFYKEMAYFRTLKN